MPLAAPLHRQYKTARTETRWHLLLKTGQMPIQTSASRGYVLFSGANKGHSQKSLNCLRLADTPPECSKLGKTRIITSGKSGGVRNSVFCDQNPPACFRWNTGVTLLTRITGTANLRCLLPQYLSLPQLFFYSVALSVTVSVSVSCTVVVNRLSNVTFAHGILHGPVVLIFPAFERLVVQIALALADNVLSGRLGCIRIRLLIQTNYIVIGICVDDIRNLPFVQSCSAVRTASSSVLSSAVNVPLLTV